MNGAYLPLRSVQITGAAEVTDRTADLGEAIVYINQHDAVHVSDAAIARNLAAAFTEAARLLDPPAPAPADPVPAEDVVLPDTIGQLMDRL